MPRNNRTHIMVECALMIAISTALSYVKLFQLPLGGSVTLCSTLPLLMVSLRHGVKWGVFTGFVHGLLQTLLGIKNVLYCTTLLSMLGCVLLDYVVAYAVLGLGALFARHFSNPSAGAAAAALGTGFLRFLCSFLSGILIWSGYAAEGTPVWKHSLIYNGSFMIPEVLLTLLGAVALVKVLAAKPAVKPGG